MPQGRQQVVEHTAACYQNNNNATGGCSQDNDQNPFLRLPAEIRNRICESVIEEDATFGLTTYWWPHGGSGSYHPTQQVREYPWDSVRPASDQVTGKQVLSSAISTFALSRVCRQLSVEFPPATHYKSNTFEFDSMKSMDVFLRCIGENQKHLRRIKVSGAQIFNTKPSTVFERVGRLPQLESLAIDARSLTTRRWRREGTMLVSTFVAAIRNYLVRWHDTHKDAAGHSTVLDTIGIGRRCVFCDADVTDKQGPCHLVSHRCEHCGKGTRICAPRCDIAHAERVRVCLKALIVEALGLSEDGMANEQKGGLGLEGDWLVMEDDALQSLYEPGSDQRGTCAPRTSRMIIIDCLDSLRRQAASLDGGDGHSRA